MDTGTSRGLTGMVRLALAAAAGVATVILASGSADGQSRRRPSERLGENIGAVTSGGQFSNRTSGAPEGPLAARFNVNPSHLGGGYSVPRFRFSQSEAAFNGLRLRTLESLSLARRARFAGLQQVSLELAGKLQAHGLTRPSEVSESFFQFVFPFGLQVKDTDTGYGFFSREALVRGLVADPEKILAAYTSETQAVIGEARFLKIVSSMFAEGEPGEGESLEDLYDSQLAAMGNYLFCNGKYQAAAEVWTVLAQRDPANSLFSQAAAQSLFAAGRLDEAASAARISLREAPGWGTPEFKITGVNLQNVYGRVEDLAAARKMLEEELTANPASEDMAFLMAYTDLFHGLWNRSRERLGVLELKGDKVAGELLKVLQEGRVSGSVRRPLAPGAVVTIDDVERSGQGLELSADERAKLAEAVLRPQSYEDFMSRGDFYFFMGNYPRASEAYSQAARQKPDDVIATFAQGHAALASAEYSYASQLLSRALAQEENWGLYNFRLEEFFGNRRELDLRIADLEHLIKIRSSTPGIKLLLGYVYYFDGRYVDAANLLAEVVEGPGGVKAVEPLLRLARLQG